MKRMCCAAERASERAKFKQSGSAGAPEKEYACERCPSLRKHCDDESSLLCHGMTLSASEHLDITVSRHILAPHNRATRARTPDEPFLPLVVVGISLHMLIFPPHH